MNDDEKVELEKLVDRVTLSQLLATLSEICHEKAEHLEENWQDYGAAEEWIEAGKAIDRITNKIGNL